MVYFLNFVDYQKQNVQLSLYLQWYKKLKMENAELRNHESENNKLGRFSDSPRSIVSMFRHNSEIHTPDLGVAFHTIQKPIQYHP